MSKGWHITSKLKLHQLKHTTIQPCLVPGTSFKHHASYKMYSCQCFYRYMPIKLQKIAFNSNMTSFFRFNKRASYTFGIISLAHECDWLFHWQHKLCATFSASVNINYRLPIKVYYRICTLRHIGIELNHGSQNVFWVLTWIGGY